ncbi:uncharacterized protein LOC113357007 isoform X2 [Papaver somniferum]|uniref:uncharacterized protein LOC113357007 isoform X2 n=1 Tax=Papaver somniferum TaxID=3469 RepID=UPI000E6F811A|nr:uncharacterized protein LOC113357007 isoform X2 [Papaver somniferum]
MSQDLEWTPLQLSGLQIAHKRQQVSSSEHKEHCPSNEFNEQKTRKIPSFGGQVIQLKKSEVLLNTKLTDTATELTRQLDEEEKKHEKKLTEKVKEGVKEFINMRKEKLAAKSDGSGSVNPEE